MPDTTWKVNDLIGRLQNDDWRRAHPFSADIQKCHEVVLRAGVSTREKMVALSDWLGEFQPCLFGQMEAKQRRLEFCILTENDLARSDDHIRAKIQSCRLHWKRKAFDAESHGFLIVALSASIAWATPNARLHELATCLCELYLQASSSNTILLDDLILELSQDSVNRWRKWKVGANFFGSQGDRRWWHDHRFPGGIAFSMNSVGHMARTMAERAIERDPHLNASGVSRDKLVYWALPKAMKTIGPKRAGSNRGTWLERRGHCEEDCEPPTFEQRRHYFGDLANFSENRYVGNYHTDHTIPSDYFDESLWREEDLQVRRRNDLYFTYLHQPKDDDYASMGLGEVIEVKGKGV